MLTGFPSSYSVVRSPRYQTVPSAACAYQSRVSSTRRPRSVTVSLTTRARIPFAISRVRCVTRTTAFWREPSGVVSR